MFTRTTYDDYVLLEFHAPESSNALSLDAARALADFKLDRPVVVRGLHPRVFCAGGNLSDHSKYQTAREGLDANAEIARALDAFAAWPVPKLAMIEGDALGGGVEWLARFDYRFVTPAVQLTFWQKRVGLSPGWGGGAAWARIIGEDALRQLLLEARALSAPEALRLKLVDRIVTPAGVDAELRRWVRDIASPISADLHAWRAGSEREVFTKLWWHGAHRAALEKWRG